MSHEALPGGRQMIDRALQEEGVRAVGFECPQPAFERRDTVVDRIDRLFAGDVAGRFRSKSAHGGMATNGVGL